MASRTLDRQPKKRLTDHTHHLAQFIRARLLLEHDIGRQHGVVHSRDEKSHSGRAFCSWLEHIPHQLHSRKFIKWHVGVESVDHPVAIRPGVAAGLVVLEAVALTVPSDVQPMPRPALPVRWRGQQFVHQSEIRPLCCVLFERLNQLRTRRQSDEVEMQPPHQRSRSRRSVLRQAGLGQAPPYKSIDWVPLSSRYRHFAKRLKRPLCRHFRRPRRHDLRKAVQRHRQQNKRFHAEAHPPAPAALGQALFFGDLLRPFIVERL